MTRILPALLVAGIVLATIAMVQGVYALLWLNDHVLDGNVAYDWSGAVAISALVGVMVLLAAAATRDLVGRANLHAAVPVRVAVTHHRQPRR